MARAIALAVGVLAALAAPLTAQTAAPPAAGVPRQVRDAVVAQLLAGDMELRTCLAEGGRAAEAEFRAQSEFHPRDLDGDGTPELVVEGRGACACGAQNCALWIFRHAAAGGHQPILRGSGVGWEVVRGGGSGFPEIVVEAHNNAFTRYRTHFRFQDGGYRVHRTDFVDLETGASKPAERRVRFRRGASADTLGGSVSPGFPDTYRIGAGAGQTMTLQILSGAEGIGFTILTPGSRDLLGREARRWSGTLPDSGDYLVRVTADRGGGAYRLYVSIR